MSMAVRRKKLLWFPIVLMCILWAYAYNDVMSSNQAGLVDMDRGIVHKLLIILISLLLGYIFWGKKSAIYSISKNRHNPVIVLVLIFLWVGLVGVLNQVDLGALLTHLLISFWWIITYLFAKKYTENHIEEFQQILRLYIIMYFVYIWVNIIARNQIQTNFERDFAITVYIYYILLFIPFIYMIQRNIIRNALLIIAIAMVATSYKRGTIICLPIMLIAYEFVQSIIKNKWFSFIRRVVFLVVAIGVFLFLVNETSGGFLSERFAKEELESGSGRSDIWDIALTVIANRSFLETIVGTGSGSSVRLLGTGAHNEWIEFLFSFGVVGVMLYASMCIIWISECLYYVKRKAEYAPHMCMMTTYLLIGGLFSGFYFQHTSFYFFSLMGVCKALNDKQLLSTCHQLKKHL